MSFGRSVIRAGTYNRLAEPGWTNPLDASYAKVAGGRWNAPGAFGALYLNSSIGLARVQVQHKLRGQPYDVEDLDPNEQHDLVAITVNDCRALDCVTREGLRAAGLPDSYPLDISGAGVPHSVCQPIGAAAFGDLLQAIACRSAAAGTDAHDEELAVFDRDAPALVRQTDRTPFTAWYFT